MRTAIKCQSNLINKTMNLREEAIKKINQLPDKLVPEVSILLDFLLTKENPAQWQIWEEFK